MTHLRPHSDGDATLDTKMAWLTTALFAALVSLSMAAGCGFDLSAQSPEREGVCTEDADCHGELVCRAHYCSVSSGEVSGLSFRFLPANSSSLRPQTAENITARADRTMKFQLDSSILVEGRVSYAGIDTGPAGTLVFNARNGGTQRVNIGEEQSYQVWLRRGVYDVSFLPDNPQQVQTRRRFEQSFKQGERRRYDFELVPAESLMQVRGRLVHGSQVTGCQLPSGEMAPENSLPQASIFAVSENERFGSTVATSDDEGRFTIRLPRDTGIYDLYVEAGDSPCVVPSMVERGSIDSSRTEISRTQVNVGPVPQQRIDLRELTVRAPEGVDPPDAWDAFTVELTAPLGRGTFRTQTRLTSGGRIPAEVPPAQYTAHITPPADSPFAPTTHTFEVTDTYTQSSLILDSRRQVEGTLLDPNGEPVPDAEVELKPLEPTTGGTMQGAADRTDASGHFELWLDRKSYVGVTRPPATTGLPAKLVSIGPEGSEMSIQLPEPLVAEGRVLRNQAMDLVGVPNLTVEARVERGPHVWTLGQAQTSDDGYFGLVLPASLE